MQDFFNLHTWAQAKAVDQLARDLEALVNLERLSLLDNAGSPSRAQELNARIQGQLKPIQGPLRIVARPLSDHDAATWEPLFADPGLL